MTIFVYNSSNFIILYYILKNIFGLKIVRILYSVLYNIYFHLYVSYTLFYTVKYFYNITIIHNIIF